MSNETGQLPFLGSIVVSRYQVALGNETGVVTRRGIPGGLQSALRRFVHNVHVVHAV